MNYLNHNKRIVELCNGTYGESQSGKLFFPYEYVPETIQTTIANVGFDVALNYNPTNSTLAELDIYFFTFCHIEAAIIKDEPGLRYDLIIQEIIKDFADKDFLGIGKTQVIYNKPYVSTQKIRGRALNLCVFDIAPELYNRRAGSLI